MPLTHRMPAILLAPLTLCAAILVAAGWTTGARAEDDANAIATFTFSRDYPGHKTTLVIVRNEQKLRPLFASGRGDGGAIELDLANPTNSRAEFSLVGWRYDASRTDAERTAGTDWVDRDEQPELVLNVERFTDWDEVDNGDGEREFEVTLAGNVEVDGESTAVEADATLTVFGEGAVQGHDTAERVQIDARFEVEGRALGLGGDDAGTLAFRFDGFGFNRE